MLLTNVHVWPEQSLNRGEKDLIELLFYNEEPEEEGVSERENKKGTWVWYWFAEGQILLVLYALLSHVLEGSCPCYSTLIQKIHNLHMGLF